MKKLKIAGIILVLFILYVIIGMLVPFVHMQSVSKTNKSKIHTETFYSTSNEQRLSVIIRKHLICGWI